MITHQITHQTHLMTMNFYEPPPIKEKFDERLMIMAPKSMTNAIDKEAATNHETRSDIVRRALEQYYTSRAEIEQPYTFTAPMLGEVPCGPWDATQSTPMRFTVSEEVADELEMREGDWWFRARGTSMVGAGIPDGAMVAVRPYEDKPPRRHEIVAVQIAYESGEVEGTFKRFDGFNGNVPRLVDGNDEPFELPDGAHVHQILARGFGVVSRL